MSSMRDRILAKQGLLKPPPDVENLPPPAETPAPAKAKKKPAKETERVTYRCGCVLPPVNYNGLDCPACREKIRKERGARNHAKREAEQAASPNPIPQDFRFPDGTVLHKTYNAARQVWTGTLIIEGAEPFTAEASGSFRLERELTRQYLERVAADE